MLPTDTTHVLDTVAEIVEFDMGLDDVHVTWICNMDM